MVDHVHVHPHDEIDRIAPEIYGHFAEHLGRCIYGGLWVGDDAEIETENGIRTDTLGLLEDIELPMLRWPGGCFADDYHWEDGIGPREERPRRRNLWWAQGREEVFEESNAFGTDEFLQLCERLDTEPYLASNVGSGSPTETVDWVEYCNFDGDTDYANRRRENGRDEPYDVPYWGVGNENWGCGGKYDPGDYALEFRRFAQYLRGYDRNMGDGSLELIACGHTTESWNREFMAGLGGDAHMVDHLSIHRYYSGGDAVDFDEEAYYKLFSNSLQLDGDIERTAGVLETYAPGADIGIAVDEWGVWHDQATADNGLEQPQTVRDAVSAAGVLDIFNSHADRVTMANLAQTVNVLQCLVETDEESAWATPTYRVFDLYTPHIGATALRTVVETDEHEVDADTPDVPLVSASASHSDGGVYVTLSNRDLEARTVAVDTGLDAAEAADGAEILFAGTDPSEFTTSDNADSFAAEVEQVETEGGTVTLDVPASSVVGVHLE
ncbi:alpha-N-arabinofuranosidase [Halogranum gelatinilyticum]|uniref:non-reducing end alpha-L-arabinofuranosidase n=1 Tax=Halogranum gelatinilyticum TaxID=660521 RepID=A0A1G9YY04_9EURY|nr:alpha-L-arabinofuranosidase C-terminal domain-containing protein [Halogranum gelatinilyticum]SDN14018.1 alpha-N-arabinofuranosidase [Halogranum gelatinilyticum]